MSCQHLDSDPRTVLWLQHQNVTRWLAKITYIYSPTILGTRSPRSKCRPSSGDLLLASLLASRGFRHPWGCSHSTPISASVAHSLLLFHKIPLLSLHIQVRVCVYLPACLKTEPRVLQESGKCSITELQSYTPPPVRRCESI